MKYQIAFISVLLEAKIVAIVIQDTAKYVVCNIFLHL